MIMEHTQNTEMLTEITKLAHCNC